MGVKECGIMEKKKDLRVQKTYRALMAAFEALMAEETFDDITVNAVTDCQHRFLLKHRPFSNQILQTQIRMHM